ncbi:MAG: PssE/Cps14G family polysaccharide biosynthesis glycosyltransferase [Syntrophobacteraceae bacterium]|jgi:UDP-N-acetylglucosamine transferase subunit ALG13
MIFATAGTTQFDELVEAIDKIAPELNEEVIIQVGYNSKYEPLNCTYFIFSDNVIKYFREANIVIAHGGAGITFEVLNLGKKLISVENPNALDGHQSDLLGKLSQEGYLIWCKDLNEMKKSIEDARNSNIKKYVRPKCEIGKTITEWLG